MSADFEQFLVNNLLSSDEIDWEEDRVTLRVMSNGEYSDAEEAAVWGKLLASISSKIVNKLLGKYQGNDERLIQLYEIIKQNFLDEVKSEITDLTT